MIGLTYFRDPLGLYRLSKESQLEVIGMLRADAELAEEQSESSWGPPPPGAIEETPGAWDRFNTFRVA